MARIEKFTKDRVSGIIKHNNRTADDGVEHSNECIHLERTPNNLRINQGGMAYFNERLSELYYQDRENLSIMAEAVVTLPCDVKDGDEEKFFRLVYNFYCNDFGEKNIFNAVVHNDETTPHIHLDFIPVKGLDNLTPTMEFRISNWQEQNEGRICQGIISARDVLTPAYFQKMHPRLYQFVADGLGYEVEILNGATAKGNKTVLELKNQTLEKKISFLERTADEMADNIEDIIKALDSLGLDRKYFDIYEILMKEQALQTQNEIMLKALKENGITLEIDDINRIKELNAMLKTSNFNYKNGILTPEKGVYTIIEGSLRNPDKVSPQQAFIEADKYLKDVLEKNKKNIKMPTYLDFDKKYVYFPTDSQEDTYRGMMFIREQNIKQPKIKKLALEKISNDEVGIAEQILKNCNFEVDYYISQRRQKEAEREKGL